MPYIEFTGPPACGKTFAAMAMMRQQPALAPGRRSLKPEDRRAGVGSIGLPPEGAGMWWGVLGALPRALTLAQSFRRDTGSVGSAWRLLSLLVKSRAQAGSPRLWVVDQGLQQHVLTEHARGRLSLAQARRWQALCLGPPWGPQQLVTLRASREDLVTRVSESAKHRRQCHDEPPEAYVDRYLEAISQIGTLEAHCRAAVRCDDAAPLPSGSDRDPRLSS
jgi:hypothetical protein